MSRSRRKRWADDDVAISHGYDKGFSGSKYSSDFMEWLKLNFKPEERKVLEVGFGRGRIPLTFQDELAKYVGFEINQLCLDTVNNDGRLKDHVKLFLQDIEDKKGFIGEAAAEALLCNVCYIDSTITMVKSPKKVLEFLLSFVDYIYLDRTIYDKMVTTKSLFKWGGMKSSSWNWKFSKSFFLKLCSRQNCTCEFPHDRTIIIRRG